MPGAHPESALSVNSVNSAEERKKETFRPGNSLADQIAALTDDEHEAEPVKAPALQNRAYSEPSKQREVLTI
jgi:hypothetical protein